ncbi:hypothetical protein KFK09_025634 [Dendrobium nobile]|uniref:RING-type domain-containing protein n=1 Tax=Dendrobium nobile TaxID=94219 RepID=A0A8T3A5Y0_DENNO|nr:hypothetical protein KFK09_025634 [Dendrobium nobile]
MDHSPGGTDMLFEDFGQRVDLTRRIREVLVNYPEGTTVLKELIQNADDAGATKVVFCLDRRFHGVDSLLSSELSQFQGPALLAYNDAVFTEEDFVSISRIGDSKKHSQSWKTGRFGVGFNSVYHLTDLPSFVSNKYVVYFDPHGSHLPNVSAANPGKRLDFASSSAMPLYEDQFKPYCIFGCDMKNPFPGTLFRFPLRNADQAAVSKLSKQAYTADDISLMFSELHQEAVFSLLFLKSIISIEMYVWDVGVNKPLKVYSCALKDSKENIALNRRALLRLYSSMEVQDLNLDSFLVNFLCEAITGGYSDRRLETFFIVQGMASASSKLGTFAAMAAKEYDLHLLPQASVALCLSDDLPEDHVLKQGQVFCSLPLPVRTGFNVHVDGYFEVYSNRRSIWFGSDLDRGGKLKSDWNRLLLEYVVAPAYCELLVGLSKLLGPTKLYYSAWPTGLFEKPWSILAENIYRIVYSKKVLYSNFEGGNWICPAEAFFHDMEFSKNEILGEALVLLGMPVVFLPGIIFETMYKYWSNFRISLVSPIIVRSFLKESEKLGTLNKSYKLVLLEYCLTGLRTEDVNKHVEGLALLPLANGEFGTFTKTIKGTNYFICSDLEYTILGSTPDIMIDRTIPSDLFSILSEIARSSQSNLAFLNEKNFLQLFPRLFPSEWRYKNRVPWNPCAGTSHLSATWFTYFWDYIQGQSYDISSFGEWPILPSTAGYLYRTSKTSKFINAEKLPEPLRDILVKIGCKILDPAYKIKQCDLSLYISDSDAGCILDSIFDTDISGGNEIWLLFQVLSVPEKIELRRFLLDPQWYHGGFLSDIHIKLAKKLPIYRVYGEQHSENIHFHNLENPTRYLPPVDIPEFFLDGDFVFCSSIIEEEILLRYFGIERMPKSAFYKKYVLSRLDELQSDVRDTIMLSVLKELPQLCLDDSSFKESMRRLKFIPTASGSLDCPESLYDPRVDELYALLEESNCFPGGLFGEHSVLDMLLCLGLRTSVSSDTIIKSARLVESLMREDQLKAFIHGTVLLSYLEVHANKWYKNDSRKGVNMVFSKGATSGKPGNFHSQDGIEKFWNDLRMICWCPVLDSAPHAALPWPAVSSMVAPPKIVRPREDIWLVSASSRILDGECRSLALFSGLGWSSPPSGTVIAAQLLELGKNNEIVVDRILRQELAIAMPKIYSLLTNLIGSDEMDIVKAILEGCRWIWVGDGFSTVSEVVLHGQFHLAPYMRVIPVDLAVFRDLFLELGIPEYLKPADYANILCRMADKKGCTPLDAHELRAAVSMAQHLAEIQSQHLYVKIYLPDFLSRLIPATDLVYNDAPWLLDLGENASGDGYSVSLKPKNNIHNFVHGNISNDIAEKLGVSSLRRLLLAESSDSMNLSLSGVAEAFGQHEALTTRLKHIVEMYADGPGILFELVQNAEDAQASEVVFLLDKTQYGTSSILSPQMAEWQGPALYCFNDSVFSSQDLYAISRIGQDSKLDKPFAIGRFGLGFNCVYHFTDIPGFVSGENIVIFDPHASHLPGISPTHPGLRIKFVGRRILEQFPDQFMPFLHFGCDLQQPFPGTLFRFPLRNETSAHRSQIKKEKYSPEDVELLFSSFTEVVSESLLFLHNIQRVTIFIKDGSSHEMQLIHRVSRHSDGGLGKEPHPHHNMLSFVHGNHQNGMDRDQFMTKLDKIVERDLPWNCQKIVLLEQSPSGSHLNVWVVSECIGGGRAKSKSLSVGNQSFKFIPWASVACYLHSANLQDLNDDDFLDAKVESYVVARVQTSSAYYRKKFWGRAFSFLPLPISTGLPAHINAYFELSSNRRDIWFGDDMAGGGKVRSEWNLCVLEDVIAPAYGHLLVFIAQEVGPCDLYFSFWPTSTGLEPWESMVRKFYVFLSDQRLPVLYTKARGGQWISARQAIFPDFNFRNAIELAEALSEAGLPVANVSNEIVKRFMDSCPSLHFLTPQLLRSILIRHHYGFKEKVASVTALEYCLSDHKVISSCDILNGLPLLPLADGKFTSFNRRGEGDRVFATSTEVFDLLVNRVPYLLVDCSVPDTTLKKLRDIANSGLTNLHVLTCYSVVELLPRILPTEWQHSRQVRWTPGHQDQPSLEWMGLFWSYLKASCNDLSIFNTWPILPVRNGFLLQLVENSAVIRDDGWSENMSSLLQKLGCSFLRSDLPLDHPHLRNFVQDATATGILNALQASCQLQDIKNLFLNASKAEMRELRSFIFQSKWFSGDQMGSMQIDIIKHLPIFESYKNDVLLTLTNPLKSLKPADLLEDLIDDSFIRTESEREKSILQNHLGIRELPKAEFYKNFVFNSVESFLGRTTFILDILVDLKLLAEEDDSIKSALSEMSFVLAADGSWRHPSRFPDQFSPLLMKQGFCSVLFDSTFIRMPLSSKGLEENGFGCKRVMHIFNRFMNQASSALLSLKRYLTHNLTPFAGVAAHISQNGQPISPPASSCILSPLPLSGVLSMPVTVIGCFLISHIGGRYLFSHSDGHVLTEQANAKGLLAEAWNKELLLCIRDSYVQLVLEFQKIRKDYHTSCFESNSARALSYILQAYGDRIYSFWPRSKKNSKSYGDVDSASEETVTSKASEADWVSLVEQVIRPFYYRLVDMPVWQLYCGNVVKADEGMFLSQFSGENGDNLPPARVCSFLKERYPVFSMPSELVKEIQALGVKVREITPKMIRGLLKSSVSVLPESVEMYIDVLDYCLSDIQMPDLSASELSGFNNRLDSVGALHAVSDDLSTTAAFLSSMKSQRIHRDAFQSSSSSAGDALEIVTYFGKALYDFGRGVVEDIGKAADPLPNVATASGMSIYSDGSLASILAELKGLPFPTSTKCLLRLGIAEILIGSKEQQLFMYPLADKFIHTLCLEKSFLSKILFTQNIHGVLKLKSFNPQLVAEHLRLLLTESWVIRVLSVNQAPWVSWDNTAGSVFDGPRPEWIRLFWKIFRDIKGDLSLISDWPLIPAVLNRPILCRVKEIKLIFIPPMLEQSTVTFDGTGMINSSESIVELKKIYSTAFEMISSRYPWLISLLYQLSIPLYDMSFLDSAALCYFFPTPSQSLGHAIASKLLAAKYAGRFSVPLHLSDENRDRLFTLFALDHQSPTCCLYKREELDLLKELPIYKTVTGSYTMIVDRNQCTISPTAFFHPKDERCLSHSDANQFLHALGVDELTDQEVFLRFALPDFEVKTSAEKEDILFYLYLNWKDLQLDTTIVNCLKETNFVRTANEVSTNLFKPRDLLDPHDSLLSSVFSGERSKFPGERFTTDGWLHILRKTGLRTSSQGDMITECARKIESLGREALAHAGDLESFETESSFRKKEVPLEICSLAESVVVAIIANLSTLFNNDFCDTISNIAFVPAEKGLPMIGGKKGGNRVLCTYREAILSKDWPLAWSTAPILVKLNVIPPEFSWGAFHLRSPPPFSTVLKHLLVVGRNNGEDTLSRWPCSPGMMTVEDASFEILKYLDANWGARSSSDTRELQKVPFIPVANGTRFVTVTSLFVRLTTNLSPFAFELPSMYLPFVKILKEIGIHEVLTVDHARDLIMNIQNSCGYQRLNPNELRAIMEILNLICSSAIKSSSDRSENVFDHIVPDDGCRLVSANSCVYVDSYASQFLAEIDASRIRFCHPELPENICVTLGIKKVSDVVIEELDEPQLQLVDQIGSVPLSKIKNKLLSKQLQHALWKLIDGMKYHSSSFEVMNLEHLERSLSQVAYKLQFVKLLHTRFLLLPNNVDITRIPKDFGIPEWNLSPRHRTVHFVDKSRNKILVAEPPSYISIYDVVATVVSQILKAPSILPIGPLLACPDGSEKAFLIALKLGSEIGIIREGKTNILAGKELVPQDALQVQLLPMRPFYRGEIVAWKHGKEGDKLRYGVVSEDVRPTSGQAIHKIPLEIFPGVLQALLSTQVFSFKNVSMGDVTYMSSLPESSQVTSKNVLLNVQENKDSENGKVEQQTGRELRYGKVSAEETVRAVHDMLLTAGINMDTEQQTLLRTTLALQEQIKEFQVALLVEQEKTETASKEADTAKAAWSCRVCLSSEVDTAIVPCGHVLCYKCCSEVHRCPFCRCFISNKQKIFRP